MLFEWNKCRAVKAVVAPGQALLLGSCTSLSCDQVKQSFFKNYNKEVVAPFITFFPPHYEFSFQHRGETVWFLLTSMQR